jgi:hypothetical protein
VEGSAMNKKKIIITICSVCIIAVVIVCICIAGRKEKTSNMTDNSQDYTERSFFCSDTEHNMSLLLHEDKTFNLGNPSNSDSNSGVQGTYTIEDDKLILNGTKENSTYIFKFTSEDTLTFVEEESGDLNNIDYRYKNDGASIEMKLIE